MALHKITRRQSKDLYKYFCDAGNRFACSGVWSMDTAVLYIAYRAKIRQSAKFRFQQVKKFRIVYENDANLRYLISTLEDLDKR